MERLLDDTSKWVKQAVRQNLGPFLSTRPACWRSTRHSPQSSSRASPTCRPRRRRRAARARRSLVRSVSQASSWRSVSHGLLVGLGLGLGFSLLLAIGESRSFGGATHTHTYIHIHICVLVMGRGERVCVCVCATCMLCFVDVCGFVCDQCLSSYVLCPPSLSLNLLIS